LEETFVIDNSDDDDAVKILEDKLDNAIKMEKYEEAARLRDVEKQLHTNLEEARKKWDDEQKNNKQTVTEDNVAEVVSMMTGIPLQKVGQKESEKLSNMGNDIMGSVIGQDSAVESVIKSIQRGRVGLKDPNRPIGTFLFLGPTGVGKTQLCKILAKQLFDSEDSLIRVDMSEFMEKFAVSRLIGAPPGYVGHDEGGQLTEKVRRKPYSVILLDEIEKAHSEVFNILLQVLDDGQLTDSVGRRISFKNTVIIMTSNTGSRQLKDFGTGIGFSSKNKEEVRREQEKEVIEKELKKTFAPEFLNRIDEIITFNSLSKEDINKIIDIEINKVVSRMKNLEFELELTETAMNHISEKGYDPEYGARPLKRAIQKYVEDPITEEIIKSNPKKGTKMLLDYDVENEVMKVTTVKEKKSKKK
jgi:ATP-dependent Clp protease ATP-binding subunit ClpC